MTEDQINNLVNGILAKMRACRTMDQLDVVRDKHRAEVQKLTKNHRGHVRVKHLTAALDQHLGRLGE